VADRSHPDADQVLRRQLRQNLGIDIVVAERGYIAFEAQALQPCRYIHAEPPVSATCVLRDSRGACPRAARSADPGAASSG
jgi:hypothetical protein